MRQKFKIQEGDELEQEAQQKGYGNCLRLSFVKGLPHFFINRSDYV